MRRCSLACYRAVVAVLALAAFSMTLSVTADAKPTGWQRESEVRKAGSSAWAGYGDSGYVARPKPARSKAAKAKSKALKAYGASYNKKPKKQASAGKKKRYAALDTGAMIDTSPKKSVAGGGGIRWVASAGCLNGTLRSVVAQVAANYGSVTVSSTCRGKAHNRKVGGAKKSHHLTGDAVDFRVRGNVGAVYAYLRSHGSIGGVKHYGGGLFHIDTGPRRSW